MYRLDIDNLVNDFKNDCVRYFNEVCDELCNILDKICSPSDYLISIYEIEDSDYSDRIPFEYGKVDIKRKLIIKGCLEENLEKIQPGNIESSYVLYYICLRLNEIVYRYESPMLCHDTKFSETCENKKPIKYSPEIIREYIINCINSSISDKTVKIKSGVLEFNDKNLKYRYKNSIGGNFYPLGNYTIEKLQKIYKEVLENK